MVERRESERSVEKRARIRSKKTAHQQSQAPLKRDQTGRSEDYANMEDAPRCTEEGAEVVQEEPEDCEQNEQNGSLEISQLQGLVVELREGLHAALTELCELRQRDQSLEEQLQAHQSDVDDKIMSLKNSLNTFKEELSTTLFHIKEMSSRQREIHRRIELLQLENPKDVISTSHSRKSSKADVLAASGEEHVCGPSQSELSVIQHYLSSLPHNASPQRSNASTHTSTSEPETPQQRGHGWGERKNSRDEGDNKNNKRQRAALELLESERVYVSHLSLLLKANISFNGSDALTTKDKRSFPSSLRFLIQQHLELLHTLQERVLKCQWQGIMGDVFMRLTSKESDFLDFYVSYLKELPDCLSVISMVTSGSIKSSLLESDVLGDESKPSLYSLLLQPVQRIPEYLLLLQGLLRQTEAEHPDYFLLLVSIQQFRSFTAQYHHLLQHNQELLLHNRKEIKREQAKRNKQRLLEQMQTRRFPDWDHDHDPERYVPEWASQLPFFNTDMDSRHKSPGSAQTHSNGKGTVYSPVNQLIDLWLSGLGSIPESEVSCQLRGTPLQGPPAPSAMADALGEYLLLPPDPPGMESLYEEDRGSLHDVSMFDRCSSASSDSSIDIAFVKCPKAPSAAPRAAPVNVLSPRDLYGNGVSPGNGYSKLLNRGCVSPDEAILMRRNQPRPLQASQRKSKSLNGLQLENTVSGGVDNGHLSDNLQRAALGSHAKLERQSSKGSKGCPTPSRKIQSPTVNKTDADKQIDDVHGLPSIDSALQSWSEELRWRGDEGSHTSFTDRNRKQEKGGFRSSFKKLFKKKSSDEKKEKGGDKTPDSLNGEHEKSAKLVHLEVTRGTAV
ncbi:rho guanine nucleotide exchange factor 33 [Periophthalmus magnuspinnatus]|uniref:rho guanine nucleotide exchange factor 33 n=1 Tax=Periophthalmus magnuspinnatus TaxID=409849 RepID=UPI0024363DB0|nr:rho guanine nucleotide exchange factor 33 [Periophthalmus magnuspinnatus]